MNRSDKELLEFWIYRLNDRDKKLKDSIPDLNLILLSNFYRDYLDYPVPELEFNDKYELYIRVCENEYGKNFGEILKQNDFDERSDEMNKYLEQEVTSSKIEEFIKFANYIKWIAGRVREFNDTYPADKNSFYNDYKILSNILDDLFPKNTAKNIQQLVKKFGITSNYILLEKTNDWNPNGDYSIIHINGNNLHLDNYQSHFLRHLYKQFEPGQPFNGRRELERCFVEQKGDKFTDWHEFWIHGKKNQDCYQVYRNLIISSKSDHTKKHRKDLKLNQYALNPAFSISS